MVPMLLHDVLRNTAADVIVLVGETGGGKTLSILAAAYEYGIMFYYKCNYLRLNFRDLEKVLDECDPTTKNAEELVADLLLREIKWDYWTPAKPTDKNVCIVIKNIDWFAKCARAMCKLQSIANHNG